ncbi:MAG: hypothetical protein U0797_18025 [Gemmataceae bacterium]
MELQVADVEVLQAGVLADDAALDRRPGDEQARRRAVVGAAAAVLVHAPAELRERHQPHPLVVAGALQRSEEVADGVAQLGQELGVGGGLAGVRVEAAEADVEHPRAEALGDQAGHQPELAEEPPTGARHGVLPLQQLSQRLDRRQRLHLPPPHERGQVVLRRLPRRRRQVGEQPAAGALLGGLAAGEVQAEGVLVVDADRPAAGAAGQGQRQAVGAEVQERHAALAGLELPGGPAQPAGLDQPLGVGRLPDVHRLEVGAVGVGVADALHDGQLARLPHRPQPRQRRVQADVVVQADDDLPGQPQRGADLVVEVVGVWGDGVDAVVSAGQFHHDEDVVLARRGRLGGPGQDLREGRPQSYQRRGPQGAVEKLPAGEHSDSSIG